MPSINPRKLARIIGNALDDFYLRRQQALTSLKLRDVLKSKNPYLYRATGYAKASDIVEEILKAHLTSSDEGIFGDAFFERVAREVVETVHGGNVSTGESGDIEIHTRKEVTVYAVKSGPSAFNAQSIARQDTAFGECRKRLAKLRKHFEAVVGYGYGNRQFKKSKYGFRQVAGQDFWKELTGDSEFYLRLIRMMGSKPQRKLPAFKKAYAAALNRFLRDFTADFCLADGSIDWVKLTRFNSASRGKIERPRPRRTTPKKHT